MLSPVGEADDGEPDPTRIAVLAIEAPGGDPDLQAFAANLTERLTDGLAAIDALTVISRSGVRPYLEARVPVDSIARALRVGLLIDGHLETVRDTVRIALRLIDGRTGDQVAVTQANAALGQRHALVDAVADTVTRLLRQSLGTAVRMRRRLLETSNASAFEHVRWAESRIDEFGALLDVGNFAAAQRVLREWDSLLTVAERLDPRWIEPVLGRARLAQFEIQLAAARNAPDDGSLLRRGLAHAERAIAMAPADPRARHVRGLLRYTLWSSHPAADTAAAAALRDSAEADLRAAVDGNADRAAVLRLLSELTARAGHPQEAVHYAEQAYEADPYLENTVPFLLRLFEYNLALDRDEAAARWCRLGAERFPEMPMFYHCQLQLLAWSAGQAPDPDRASVLRARTLAYYPAAMRGQLEGHLSLLVAAVLARAGRPDSARRIVERQLGAAPGELGVVLPAAGTLVLLGDSARALDLAEAYVAAHPGARETLRRGPELRPLRNHPRFAAILGTGTGS
jgi:TolB-like protein